MNSNLTMQDIEHIQALVNRIDRRIQDYLQNLSTANLGALADAVIQTNEFLNGYAAALRHFEKKEAA